MIAIMKDDQTAYNIEEVHNKIERLINDDIIPTIKNSSNSIDDVVKTMYLTIQLNDTGFVEVIMESLVDESDIIKYRMIHDISHGEKPDNIADFDLWDSNIIQFEEATSIKNKFKNYLITKLKADFPYITHLTHILDF